MILDLAPLVCGVLLAATGAAKLFGRRTAQVAANTVLVRVLGNGHRAAFALRAVGAAELAAAAGLLAVPGTVLPGAATALLGAGFTGYLGYAKATAPQSSCGCSARDEGPIGARAFLRAGAVLAAGVAAAFAGTAWWSRLARDPGWSVLVLAAAAAALLALSRDLDRVWMPLRRLRVRVFGTPLPSGPGGRVPLEASVELLERSLAWQASSPIVRSGLLDSWDEGGWRVLRYAGVHAAAGGARPVNVLFALDDRATTDANPSPAVRVSVVDDRTQEVVPVDLLALSGLHRPLRMV
ncbi:MauE/DoxX family redox-associated membrane protein [Actinacidiphila sp. bgisy144]|uniref:MauE/DoxX family redox-associated membrane protein n=1 Tax=Actinacidiphila sp. bgisy144 TaxID=3413791 RepID=UPI003EB8F04C